jgi:hypothetical protein
MISCIVILEVGAPPFFDFPVNKKLTCDHVSCPKMDGPPAFRILEARFTFHFKERAGSPRSDDGRSPFSDLMPEIHSLLLCTPSFLNS